jgi:hypothetical protein
MTEQQYKRHIAAHRFSEAREAELRRLALAQTSADPRYVENVVDFLWNRWLERKLAVRDSLPQIEQKRLTTLVRLVA